MRRGPRISESMLRAMAREIRQAYPDGIDRAVLALRHGVSPATWRTHGFEEALYAVAPDIYRVPRTTVYHNDPERTVVLATLHWAVDHGETERAIELRQRWDELRSKRALAQLTLDLE
jgi:hypothetical protein